MFPPKSSVSLVFFSGFLIRLGLTFVTNVLTPSFMPLKVLLFSLLRSCIRFIILRDTILSCGDGFSIFCFENVTDV